MAANQTSTVSRVLGWLLIAIGVSTLAWGLWHLPEPPFDRDPQYRYVASGELVWISAGAAAILLGAVLLVGIRKDDSA